jgi:hypothetical protein
MTVGVWSDWHTFGTESSACAGTVSPEGGPVPTPLRGGAWFGGTAEEDMAR